MVHKCALSVKGLSVYFGGNPVLWDVSVEVPSGHLVGILGPNGAGKTTFIKAVLGLLNIASGSIHILSRQLRFMRKKVAYVPQRACVNWDFPMTIYDLVLMGRYPKRGLFQSMQNDDYEAVEKALCIVGLEKLHQAQISQLSGGQQQRAFIARMLVQEAEVYFLDEPFEGIDIISEHIIIDVLRCMKEEGKTVFIVHHDLITVKKYFDWGILLNTCLIANGPLQEVLKEEILQLAYGGDMALVGSMLQEVSSHLSGTSTHDHSR